MSIDDARSDDSSAAPLDRKTPNALRTIGEVASALGIKTHVLRYWEQQFPMLRPLKRSGARRYYRREDVALLQRIDRLINREGYTIKGARLALEAAPGNVAKGGSGTAAALAAPSLPAADRTPVADRQAALLPKLRSVRERLASALRAA